MIFFFDQHGRRFVVPAADVRLLEEWPEGAGNRPVTVVHVGASIDSARPYVVVEDVVALQQRLEAALRSEK